MCTSAASGLFSFPPDQKWRLMAQYAYTRRCVRPSLNKVLHRKLGSRLSKGDEHFQVFKIRAAWTDTPSCFPHGFSVDCTGKDQGCRKFVPLRVCMYVNIHRCFGRLNICSACREGDRFDPVESCFSRVKTTQEFGKYASNVEVPRSTYCVWRMIRPAVSASAVFLERRLGWRCFFCLDKCW